MSTIVEPSYCFETFHSMLSDEECVSSLRSSQVKRRIVWSATKRMVPGTVQASEGVGGCGGDEESVACTVEDDLLDGQVEAVVEELFS
jgi:hypothetical protein